jgi:hypothetical protein
MQGVSNTFQVIARGARGTRHYVHWASANRGASAPYALTVFRCRRVYRGLESEDDPDAAPSTALASLVDQGTYDAAWRCRNSSSSITWW